LYNKYTSDRGWCPTEYSCNIYQTGNRSLVPVPGSHVLVRLSSACTLALSELGLARHWVACSSARIERSNSFSSWYLFHS
jgi:hypothetical protein